MCGQRYKWTAIILFSAFFACIASSSAAASTVFHCDTVAFGSPGNYASLALDAESTPHIAYIDPATNRLICAYRLGTEWICRTVVETGSFGPGLSIALDADGNPCISYFDQGILKYAAESDGEWTSTTVDGQSNNGYYSSLAFDHGGVPHISYFEGGAVRVKHAVGTGDGWTIEIADPGPYTDGFSTSLRLDDLGDVHIAYSIRNRVLYATNSGGSWTHQTIDSLAVSFGGYVSLAVEPDGTPHVAYPDQVNYHLRYATCSADLWSIEIAANGGAMVSIALDSDASPHISHKEPRDYNVWYSTRKLSTWRHQLVASAGCVSTSIALDGNGDPCVAIGGSEVLYAESGFRLLSPSGGNVWPVGALRQVMWSPWATGPISIHLSVDGGYSYSLLYDGIDEDFLLRVPHVPTRFARLRICREDPYTIAESDSFFTISSEIILQSFKAQPKQDPQGGVALTWATDPGPEDLSGYKLEKRTNGSAIWTTVVDLTKETTHEDNNVDPGTTYRLFGVNGWGDTYYLGEASVPVPTLPLRAWPLPYRGGNMEVTFQTASGLGGAPGQASVKLYDLQGRLVRTLASGPYPSGTHRVTWDGCDEIGNPAATGIYMLNLMTGGEQRTLKVAVVR